MKKFLITLLFLLIGCASKEVLYDSGKNRFSTNIEPCMSCVRQYNLHENIKNVKKILLLDYGGIAGFKESVSQLNFDNVEFHIVKLDYKTGKLAETVDRSKFDIVITSAFSVNRVIFTTLSVSDGKNPFKVYLNVGQVSTGFGGSSGVQYSQLNLLRQWYEDSLVGRSSRTEQLMELKK